MTTAREIMHSGASCVQENENLVDAARRMSELDVGALPICGPDDRLHGIITDRDIVVKCLAKGKDPHRMTAGTSPRASRSPWTRAPTAKWCSARCRTTASAACP